MGTPEAGTLDVRYAPNPDGSESVSFVCEPTTPYYALHLVLVAQTTTVDCGPFGASTCTVKGEVAITEAPGSFGCSTNGDTYVACPVHSYPAGTTVVLTEHTTSGTFGSWVGCDSSTATTCTVTLGADAYINVGVIPPTSA